MKHLGLVRVAAITPVVKVGNTTANAEELIQCIEKANQSGAAILVFPELCVTGVSAKDLFRQEFLYEKQIDGLKKIVQSTKNIEGVCIVGFYLRQADRFYNCAAIIQQGKIKGIVPKFMAQGAAGNETGRWFSDGKEAALHFDSVMLFESEIPFGNLLFADPVNDLRFGIEMSDDLYHMSSPGTDLCFEGAHLLCNPFSEPELVAGSIHRKQAVEQRSKNCHCGYVLASAGSTESTTDSVFSGHSLIAECGNVVEESARFQRNRSIVIADIDIEEIRQQQSQKNEYKFASASRIVNLSALPMVCDDAEILHLYSKTPFIPEGKEERDQNCFDVFSIQASALAGRFAHTGSDKALLGISGGLDSTLALLVTVEAFRILGKPASDIIAVTMPGFGTTGKTYNNALSIMKTLGVDLREIPISDSVLLHFKDISHDSKIHNAVYENAQARERTQILMDLANMENGIHVGTGDLSEEALGWCTYNGDHMAMYNVNAGVPKTVIRVLIKWIIDNVLGGPAEEKEFSLDNAVLAAALQNILDTPISPELLPPGADGEMTQKTEDKVGPYVLHDFFIYHTVRNRIPPKKLFTIAKLAFAGDYEEADIKKYLQLFYRRFFSQQFKKNCAPDGPTIGTISLSPNGGFSMVSDVDSSDWLESLD